MALIGYEAEIQKIVSTIASIRKQLGVRIRGAAEPAVRSGAQSKHRMSVAGRKHIANAQRKRWAAYHAKHNAPARRAAPKRRSAERRAAPAANLAKARPRRLLRKQQRNKLEIRPVS
jgi:hypothetical protein